MTDETGSLAQAEKLKSLYARMVECAAKEKRASNEFYQASYLYIPSLLCVIGLCGNIATYCALRKDPDKKNASTFLLKVLTVVDSLFLLINAFDRCIRFVRGRTYLMYLWSYNLTRAHVYLSFLFNLFQGFSACSVLLVTINRYIAACLPYRQHLRTVKRMKLAVAITFTLLTGLHVMRSLPRMTAPMTSYHDFCVNYTIYVLSANIEHYPPYRSFDEYYLVTQLVTFITPALVFALMSVLNALLIARILRQKRQHRSGSSVSMKAQEVKMVVMTLFVVLAFFLCALPMAILDLISVLINVYKLPHTGWRTMFYSHYYKIANNLLSLNSAINFLIYCIVWSKFRKLFLDLWR